MRLRAHLFVLFPLIFKSILFTTSTSVSQTRPLLYSLAWASTVLAIAFLLPNHYPPWLTFHQQLAAAVAFAPIVVWSVFAPGKLPLISRAAALLGLVPIAQIFTGQLQFHGDGVMGFLYLMGFSLVSIAGARTVSSSRGARELQALDPLWVAFLLAGIVSVGISVHQWLDLRRLMIFVAEMPPSGRPFGNLAQPNLLASLLLLGLAGTWFLYEARRVGAMTAWLSAGWILVGLILTGSRFPLLCLLGAVVARKVLNAKGWRAPAYWLWMPALAFIAGNLLLPHVSELLLLSPATTAAARASTPGIRTVLWPMMLDAAVQAPLLGYGVGQIGAAQTTLALAYPPTNWFFDSAHNLPLDLVLWFGFPIAGIFLVIVCFWWFIQLRCCSTPAHAVTFVAIGNLLIHALLEYPLQYTFFLLPFGFMSGALWAASQPSKAQAHGAPDWTVAAVSVHFAAAVMTLTAAIWTTKEYLALEDDWRRLRFEEAGIPDSTRSIASSPVLLDQVEAMLLFARTKPASDTPPGDIAWMRGISERYAYPSFMFRYALVQGLNGDPEGSSTTLHRLCKMHPPRVCNDAILQWREEVRARYSDLRDVRLPGAR